MGILDFWIGNLASLVLILPKTLSSLELLQFLFIITAIIIIFVSGTFQKALFLPSVENLLTKTSVIISQEGIVF